MKLYRNSVFSMLLGFMAIGASANNFDVIEVYKYPVTIVPLKGVKSVDLRITNEITNKIFNDDDNNDWKVTAFTKNGIVTLTGIVPSKDGKIKNL